MPVYFQALDENGYAVQTMRSWTTLQPGERLSCVGCHEHKHRTPSAELGLSQALRAGPQRLIPFYGSARGFSFIREVQPILDRHCIRCHKDSALLNQRIENGANTANPSVPSSSASGAHPASDAAETVFSLRAVPVTEEVSKRQWTEGYLALAQARAASMENTRYLAGEPNELVNWIGAQSVPEMLPPEVAGAAKSRLLVMLKAGHHRVTLSREELDKIACWIDIMVPFCGDYAEANTWSFDETQFYQRFVTKRQRMAEMERQNIQALLHDDAPVLPAP